MARRQTYPAPSRGPAGISAATRSSIGDRGSKAGRYPDSLRFRRGSMNVRFRASAAGVWTAAMGAKPLSALARQKVSYGSKCEELALSICCPLYPQSRPTRGHSGSAASCQSQTHVVQKSAPSFDHYCPSEALNAALLADIRCTMTRSNLLLRMKSTERSRRAVPL